MSVYSDLTELWLWEGVGFLMQITAASHWVRSISTASTIYVTAAATAQSLTRFISGQNYRIKSPRPSVFTNLNILVMIGFLMVSFLCFVVHVNIKS